MAQRLTHFLFVLTLEGYTISNPEHWADADCGARVKGKYVDNAAPTCKVCQVIKEAHEELKRQHAAGELVVTVTPLG